MKYPELLLVPIFMLADYFLTLISSVQKDKKYGQHFKLEHWELNPMWQNAVAARRWFNPKHLLLTILVSSAVIVLAETGESPDCFMEGVSGCVLGVFAMVLARHFSNLLLFRYVIRNPDEISGQVVISHTMALYISFYQHLVFLIPLILIAVFSTSAFVVGSCIGGILLLGVHLIWIKRAKAKRAASSSQSRGS